MKPFLIFLLSVFGSFCFAQNLSNRVSHNDPATYRELSNVHAGAGKMGFTQLIGRNELGTNFLYLHTGVIQPKSGIGHHFHHSIEEMYVILEGEAEYTINGRTSRIKAPALVPCKLGDSHGIYNASNKPLKWINFAVSNVKAKGDAFDLADDLKDTQLDEVPVFVSARLENEKLQSAKSLYIGQGITFRRIFQAEVFKTNWNHVDHVSIAKRSMSKPRQLSGVEEVYYVIKGSGEVSVNGKSTAIKQDDSFYGLMGETISWKSTDNESLELLVIGITPSKEKDFEITGTPSTPKAMALQMDFVVEKENARKFEEMYHSIYVPAMLVQDGYLSSKLLRLFPEEVARGIEAEPTAFNYQIQISFDTEENRRKWVASAQHQIAWPAASSLAKEFKWRGYDVMGDDDQR
ncbi:cupin domain-containing protein [Euzebyella saccharophila]|uniref:Cupin domain-containing protein n=1 Tax=Euzebyella saccharophila TaxID=679664 RepID=A0ABV8JQB7_9FLAO|nr:cupin domain-containing protein [Euzebyella saccharophila]